ncbi:hypothetical protein ACOMHN_014475 [Nucella lapillus]
MTKVQQLRTGKFAPFSESHRSSGQDKQTEAETRDGALAVPAWVDQCFENVFAVEPNWQLESLLGFIPPSSVPAEEQMMEEAGDFKMEGPVKSSGGAPAPASPEAESSDSSYHQQTNPIPRHKRPSHKRAELKRRDKIKTKLDELKDRVPSMADRGKMSECAILSKAADYTKHLLGDCERFATEAGNLRQEIESLNGEIHSLQGQLPAAGLKQEVVEKTQNSLDKMCDQYRTASTRDNWKFYLFNFLMKPMFESFKEKVSSDEDKAFTDSVQDWTTSSMSLGSLRHLALDKMRDISRETAIMSNPASLPEQARASIARTSNTAPSATSNVPCVSTSVSSTPSFSNVTHLSAPVVLAPSSSTTPRKATSAAAVPSSSDLPGMSAALVGSSPVAQVSLSALLGVTRSSPSNPSQPVPMTSVTSSSELAHVLVSRPSAFPFLRRQQFAQSAQSLMLPSTTTAAPRTTVQRSIPPHFLLPVSRPSIAVQKEKPAHHRQPSKAFSSPRRKRSSGHSSTLTVPENGDELMPVARKRESLDRRPVQVSVQPYRVCLPTRCEPSGQQGSVDISDIGQLAVSVQETSLHISPPINVVTPTLPQPQVEQFPTSTMTHLLSGPQYHQYDFDLTDIPLPDL